MIAGWCFLNLLDTSLVSNYLKPLFLYEATKFFLPEVAFSKGKKISETIGSTFIQWLYQKYLILKLGKSKYAYTLYLSFRQAVKKIKGMSVSDQINGLQNPKYHRSIVNNTSWGNHSVSLSLQPSFSWLHCFESIQFERLYLFLTVSSHTFDLHV